LVQHGASAVHARPRALAFCTDGCHGCGHALPQLLEHVGLRPELGRDREPHLDDSSGMTPSRRKKCQGSSVRKHRLVSSA
jgi:hypothetical protein